MRAHIFATALALAACCSSVAALQVDISKAASAVVVPPEVSYNGSLTEEDAQRLQAQRVAACVVRAHKALVLRGVQLDAWNPASRHTLEDALDARCLGNSRLVMPPDSLRGAYYQQLYRERFATAAPTLTQAPIDFVGKSSGNLSQEAKTEVALLQFGDCVARRDLGDTHALLLTLPGTEQETQVLQALMPQFRACLVQGSKWTLDKRTISAVLSEVVYREAASPTGASPK